MSKPVPEGGLPHRPAGEPIREFAGLYRGAVDPGRVAAFEARCRSLGLSFPADELVVLAALGTPDRLQEFIDTRLYYNDDHASVDQEETAMPPRRVLQTGRAHCFEGALFAYAVSFLHGRSPRLVLLEASQDPDHNLVVWRDERTGLYGSNAHSRYPGLGGRPAKYPSLRALAESYVPHYYSALTLDPSDLTLVGFSDGIDLVERFGAAWLASEDPLWDIYYTYIDETCLFHDFRDDPGRPHLYPLVRALKENWIRVDDAAGPRVSLDDLPPGARELWTAFWREFGPQNGPRPRGKAHDLEMEFMRLTGTTPIDLKDNAFDMRFFLAAGYRVGDLVSGR